MASPREPRSGHHHPGPRARRRTPGPAHRRARAMYRQWRLLAPIAPIAGGLVLLGGLIGAPRALAQSAPQGPNPSTGIAVTAEGQISAPPDVAYVNLGVQTDGQTAQAAMQANSQ